MFSSNSSFKFQDFKVSLTIFYENFWYLLPSLTGDIYGKCDQRLQLNPYGAGDDGKGGIATGYLYVVQ